MNDALTSNFGTTRWAPLAPSEALLRAFEFDDVVVGAVAETTVTADAATEATLVGKTAVRANLSAPAAARQRLGAQRRQGFRVGNLGLMVPYAEGSELTEIPPVHRLPHAPAWFAGMCNLHGALVPVFDLARRFGIKRNTQIKPMMLVLGHGADAAGVVVEGLPQRLIFDDEALVDSATVPSNLTGLVTHAALIGEQIWLDFSPAPLFRQLEQELKALA